jgi:hypothetical protein
MKKTILVIWKTPSRALYSYATISSGGLKSRIFITAGRDLRKGDGSSGEDAVFRKLRYACGYENKAHGDVVSFVPVDPDRSADPVRSGAALTPVQSADLSGGVAADRVNEDVGGRYLCQGFVERCVPTGRNPSNLRTCRFSLSLSGQIKSGIIDNPAKPPSTIRAYR